MKKERILSHLFLIILFTGSVSASIISPTEISDPIRTIACTFAKALIWTAASIAVLVFALAGVKWMYAQEDASKRKVARDTMIHCLIGLMIIAVAEEIIVSLHFTGCGGWGVW